MKTLLILNISAFANPITPLSIVACVDTAKVEALFKVLVFEPATERFTVAIIFNSASA